MEFKNGISNLDSVLIFGILTIGLNEFVSILNTL